MKTYGRWTERDWERADWERERRMDKVADKAEAASDTASDTAPDTDKGDDSMATKSFDIVVTVTTRQPDGDDVFAQETMTVRSARQANKIIANKFDTTPNVHGVEWRRIEDDDAHWMGRAR